MNGKRKPTDSKRITANRCHRSFVSKLPRTEIAMNTPADTSGQIKVLPPARYEANRIPEITASATITASKIIDLIRCLGAVTNGTLGSWLSRSLPRICAGLIFSVSSILIIIDGLSYFLNFRR